MGVNPIFGQDGQGGRRREGKREGMKAISGLNSSPPSYFFGVASAALAFLIWYLEEEEEEDAGRARPEKSLRILIHSIFLGTQKNLRTLLDSSSRPIWEVNAALRPSRIDLGCWKSEY